MTQRKLRLSQNLYRDANAKRFLSVFGTTSFAFEKGALIFKALAEKLLTRKAHWRERFCGIAQINDNYFKYCVAKWKKLCYNIVTAFQKTIWLFSENIK